MMSRIVLLVLLLCLWGCGKNAPTPISSRVIPQYPLEFPQASEQLLTKARASRSQIDTLLKSRFEISDRLELPNRADVPTEKDFFQRVSKYRLAEYQAYAARTQDPQAARAMVEKMMIAISQTVHLTDLTQATGEILNLNSAAKQLGSTDPMVELYGLAYRPIPEDTPGRRELREKFREIRRRVPDRDLGMYYDCLLAKRQVELNQLQGDGLERVPLEVDTADRKDLVYALVRHAELHKEPEQWPSAFWMIKRFQTPLHQGQQQLLFRELVRSKDVADWYKCIILGGMLVEEGWNARGESYASQVSEDKWKVFQEKMGQARDVLEYGWSLQPDSPLAATKLLSITGSGNQTSLTARQWFNQAVEAQIDYLDAYDTLQNFQLPRWGGSRQQMIGLGVDCVNTGRLDLLLPDKGLYLIWRLRHEFGAEFPVMSHPGVRNSIVGLARKILKSVEEKTPRDQTIDRWATVILKWLIDAEEYSLAQEWLDRTGFAFEADSDSSTFSRVTRIRWMITACQGPGSEVAKPLVNWFYGWSVPDAEDLRRIKEQCAALKASDPAAHTQSLCHEIESVIATWDQYETGQWTEIRCDPDLTGWRFATGNKVQVIDEQTIDMKGDDIVIAAPLARFQPPFIVEVEFQKCQGEGATTSDQWLMTGIEDFRVGGETFATSSVMVGADRRNTFHHVDDGYQGNNYGNRDKMLVRLKAWQNESRASVLGFRMKPQSIATYPSSTISIGSPLHQQGDKSGRYHRLRVRKLPYGPPSEVSAAEMEDYGRRMIDFDPEDNEGYLTIYDVAMKAENLQKAADVLNEGMSKCTAPSEIQSRLGETYYFLEQFRKAYETLQKANEFSEQNPLCAALLAEIVALSDDETIRDPARAQQIAQAARPDVYWIGCRSMALAQAAGGDYKTALQTIQRAIQLAPADTKPTVQKLAERLKNKDLPVRHMKAEAPSTEPTANPEKP